MKLPRSSRARRTVALAATSTVLVGAGLAAAVPDHTTAWIQGFGGTGSSQNEYANGMAALEDGSTLTGGSFTGPVTMGTTPLTNEGGEDPYVVKANPDGSIAWVASGGGAGSASVVRIAAFSDGSAVVAGWFTGTATFGAHSITAVGGSDIYVAKISSTGTWQWATGAGGADSESFSDVVALPGGSAAIIGYYKAAWTIGTTSLPYVGTYVANWRDNIGFAAKVNPSGGWEWATSIPSSNISIPKGIAVDGDGALYVAGYYRGVTTTFGAHSLSSGDDQSALEGFVAKLSAGGSWTWAVSTSTSKAANPTAWGWGAAFNDVTIARNGNPLVVGSFIGQMTVGSTTITAAGDPVGDNRFRGDGLVAHLRADTGSWLWARGAGGSLDDEFTMVAAQGDGVGIVAGTTATAVTIGSSSLGAASSGVVARINSDGTWGSARATGLGQMKSMSLDSCSTPYIAGWWQGTLTYAVTSPSTVLTTTPSNRWDGYAAKVSTSACVTPAAFTPSAPQSPPPSPPASPSPSAPAPETPSQQEAAPTPPSRPQSGSGYVPPVPVPASGIGRGDVPRSVVVEADKPVTARQVARTAGVSFTRTDQVRFAPVQDKKLALRNGKLVADVPGVYTVNIIVRTKSGKTKVRKIRMYVGTR